MKRRFLSLLLATVVGLSLCACHGTETEAPSGDSSETGDVGSESGGKNNPMLFEVPEGGYDGSEVTIKLWNTLWTGYNGTIDECIADFNKLYPNIHVEHENVYDIDDMYDDVMKLPVDQRPNIVFSRPDIVDMFRTVQSVAALDDLINHPEVGFTQKQLDDFVDGFYIQGKQYGDGYMYSLPLTRESEVLYYDKTFFDQNQLDVPTTWAEMEALCEQIKTIDPESVPLGYMSPQNWFVTMTQQTGSGYTSATGDHYLFDNEENRSFANKIKEWYNKKYVITSCFDDGDIEWYFTRWNQCRGYMVISHAKWGSRLYNKTQGDYSPLFEVGVARVPQYDVNNPKVYSEGTDVCVLRQENSQEMMASWLFLKFLTTNKEFQTNLALETKYIPVLKSVANDPNYINQLEMEDDSTKIVTRALKVCFEQYDAYYALPAFQNSYATYLEMRTLMEGVLSREGVVDQLFEQAMNRLNSKVE